MNHTQTQTFPEIQINLNASNFDDLVIEAIDQTFSKLGIKVKQTFYSYLENNFTLNREEIPDKIGHFVYALEQIFGTGALLIQIDVVKNLRQRVPSFVYSTESSNLSFEAYLTSLKQHFNLSTNFQ